MTWDGAPAVTSQSGIVSVPISAARSGFVALTFPRPFASTPTVVVSPRDGLYNAANNSETPTGVIIGVTNIDGATVSGSVSVNWIAKV